MLSYQIYVGSNNKIYLGLHVECLTFLPYFNQIWTFMTDFHEDPGIKCHGNVSSGSHTSYIQTDWTDGHDMTKLVGAFHDYVNGSNKHTKISNTERHTLTWQPINCAVEAVIVRGCHCCIELQLVLIRF